MNSDTHATICGKYNLSMIRKILSEHLNRHEKFTDLKGKRVLLKINLLSATEPERAVTTHPIFVEALVMDLKDRGASCIIADSPGGPFNRTNLEKAYLRSGMTDVAERTGTKLNYITTSHESPHPDGKLVKRFRICDFLDDADIVIAVPKIKTHMFTGLTCTSKIMFGAIPGLDKVGFHTRFPDTNDFCRMLLDLNDLVKPDLYIIDGIIGMDGDGPSNGRPRQIGVVLSGTDNHQIDLAVCRMVGLDPDSIPIMKASENTDMIELGRAPDLSGDASEFKLDKSFVPSSGIGMARKPPRFLRRSMVYFMTRKPRIDVKKCVGCGVCKENCAGSAIEITSDLAKIDYSKCIRCYCCHELCPHDAVFVKKSRLKIKDRLEKLRFSMG